jgi:hypothetical protein
MHSSAVDAGEGGGGSATKSGGGALKVTSAVVPLKDTSADSTSIVALYGNP